MVFYYYRCTQLNWVPFTPSSTPEIDSSDVWGMHGEILKNHGTNVPLKSGQISYYSFDEVKQLEFGKVNNMNIEPVVDLKNIVHNNFATSSKAELWYIFQLVDQTVEQIVQHVDQEVGNGHGHKVLKLILLLAPMFIMILFTAIKLLTGSGTRPIIRSDAKRI